MFIKLPSRRTLLAVGALFVVAALAIGLPRLSPTRGLERAWRDVVEAVQDNDLPALHSLLAADYSDMLDLDRDGAVAIVSAVRRHFLICTVRLEQPERVLASDKRSATTRALVRLGGQGDAVAQAAIQATTISSTPTTFRWRRESWKPWDWRLVAIDNPDAARAVARYQRELGAAGF